MSEVSWIKLSIDMFDNKKIKYIRHLPEGNTIVLIWVMLLTMAGRCNSSGMIFLTENIPYTPKTLADELGFEESTVTLAISVLNELGMISSFNDHLLIDGWEEHQNIEGMEKIREQNRLRQAKFKANKRALLEGNVTDNVTSRDSNATDIDIDIDKDIDKEKSKKKAKAFNAPSIEEISSYINEQGYTVDPENFYDFYSSKGWMVGKNKMKDWKACVRTWQRREKVNNNVSSQFMNDLKQWEDENVEVFYG